MLKPDPAGGSPSFRLVDPEGLHSEPAHDLGVALRDRNEELLACDTAQTAIYRCQQMALLTGVALLCYIGALTWVSSALRRRGPGA